MNETIAVMPVTVTIYHCTRSERESPYFFNIARKYSAMIFRLKFDAADDARAFSLWCAEASLPDPIDTADHDGCPYPRGRILEVAVDSGAESDFVELWAPMIVSFGV